MIGEVIDKVTNSIEEAASGKIFKTQVAAIPNESRSIIKKSLWVFDWKMELADPSRQVFKLVTDVDPSRIQGLMSITDKGDHIFLNLIENAKNNRGNTREFLGVASNLFAFACRISFERNYEGFVAFTSKTKLIAHYQNLLGAKLLKGNDMYIDSGSARILVRRFFKDIEL